MWEIERYTYLLHTWLCIDFIFENILTYVMRVVGITWRWRLQISLGFNGNQILNVSFHVSFDV